MKPATIALAATYVVAFFIVLIDVFYWRK